MQTDRAAWRLAAAVLIGLSLTGCVPTLKSPAREPEPQLPESFGGPREAESSAAQLNAREFFTDPKLTALIELGLENNQELNIATLEVQIANFEVLGREGEYLPKVGLGAGVGIEKVGDDTSQGVSDEAHKVAKDLDDYRLGLSASWEIDIWRRLRNARDAAARRALSSAEERRLVITTLVAEIASSYYELMALDNQLEVLNRNIDIQQQALDVVKLRKTAGRVTELAVKRFEAEVLKNQSLRYALQQEIILAENRINLLLGRGRQPIERSSGELMTGALREVATGLPTQLLEHRPDVRKAELELEACKLDVLSARARFYPSLEINAAVALNTFDAPTFFQTPGSLAYLALAEVSQPIWNRKEITAQYFSANARQMQAVFEYERAVLVAYTEVLNQLAMIENLRSAYDLRADQVAKLEESIEISTRLFKSARADYMEVLLTRREALDAEIELIETRLEQKRAIVKLYRALGGGWK